MDKIKQFFGWMKRKQFWLLSAFIAISSLAVFGITASGLGAAITQRFTEISGKYSEVQGVNSKLATHPNSYSHEKMKVILTNLEKDVQEAWETQYKYQEPYMTWPAATFRNEQKARIFEMLRPVEKFVEFPIERLEKPLSSITNTDRGVYRDYVASTFPDIVKKIGTEWKATTRAIPVRQASSAYGSGMAGGSGPGGYSSGGSDDMTSSSYSTSGYPGGPGSGMGTSGPMVNKDIVIWSQQSQQKLMNEMLAWYNPKSLPSILDIYYTQEDIWLLNNIMEIVRRTNGNAREHFQAVIKEIEFIRMGSKANRDAGTLTKLQSSVAAGTSDYDSAMSGSDAGAMGSSDYGSSDGMSGTDVSEVDPADGRYISFAPDKFFEPREGAEIRESMKSIQAENAVDAVAKRVPIRIRVKMDPSRIHQLITQCGNAPFMFEVFQVRINTTAATEAARGGSSGYGASAYPGGDSYGAGDSLSSYGSESGSYDTSGYGPGSGSGYGDSMGGYGSSSGYGPGSGGMQTQRQPQQTVVPVELYGLIYLYNPYDKESLGGVTEEAEAADGEGATADSESSASPLEKLNADLESEGIVSPEAVDVAPPTSEDMAVEPAVDGTATPDPNAAAPADGSQPNPENNGVPAGQPNAGQPPVGQPNAGQQPANQQPAPAAPPGTPPTADQPPVESNPNATDAAVPGQ